MGQSSGSEADKRVRRPGSTIHGKWLEDLDADKTEILGEIPDYLNAKKPFSGTINSVSPPDQSGKKIKSGLKGV